MLVHTGQAYGRPGVTGRVQCGVGCMGVGRSIELPPAWHCVRGRAG